MNKLERMALENRIKDLEKQIAGIKQSLSNDPDNILEGQPSGNSGLIPENEQENHAKDFFFHSTRLLQTWYSLAEACTLKGICRKTATNQKWLQPNGGKPDAIVGKRRRWHRDTVSEWLEQSDQELLKHFEQQGD